MLKAYIREVLSEMSTRYKRETGENLPRWNERLMQYADAGGHFVHFSFFPKLGLNPINKYDTPTGFYAYPLEKGKISSFATDRPYAIVVSLNDSGNFLRLSEYTEDDLQRDIGRLQDKEGLTQKMTREARKGAHVKTPGGILWNITRLMSNSRAGEKRSEKNPAWTSERADHYNDLLWIAEVLAGRSKSERQEVIDEFLENSRDTKFNPGLRERWKRLLGLARAMPEDLTPAEIKRQAEEQRTFIVNPRVSSWTQLLRGLGYDGVIDNGESIIHPSEPAQAVFFSTRALQPVDIIKKGKTMVTDDLEPQENFMEELKGLSFKKKVYKGNLSKALGAVVVTNSEFIHCTFKGADLSEMHLAGCKFIDCVFEDCNLQYVSFVGSTFESCLIKDCGDDLSGLDFVHVDASGLKVFPPNTIMPAGFKIKDESGQVVKA